jgi:serine/threonine-protein kinase
MTLLLTEPTMSENDKSAVYEFGPFTLDPRKRLLSKNGSPLQLTSKAFETLTALVSNAGSTLSKEELMDRVWPNTSVEENNLTQQISAIRKVLGERATDHKFVVTVPGRGYSFVSQVKLTDPETTTRDVGSTNVQRSVRARFEGSIGYGIAVIYILIICIPSLFVSVREQGRVPRTQTIAILQFRSTGLGDELLGMGIRDTLRAKLGSIEDVAVRPSPDLPFENAVDAGRKMHVDLVLTGSIQRDNDRVRVAVEVVDVTHDKIVWGNTFDNTMSGAFELQDAIAVAVMSALKRPHWSGSRRRSTIPSNDRYMFAAERQYPASPYKMHLFA